MYYFGFMKGLWVREVLSEYLKGRRSKPQAYARIEQLIRVDDFEDWAKEFDRLGYVVHAAALREVAALPKLEHEPLEETWKFR